MDVHRWIARIVLAAVFALSPSSVLPHAAVIRSSPAADATVRSPREVAIFFSERIQAARSSISVNDSNGVRIDAGDSRVNANGRVLRVTLKPLSGGTYQVKWRVRSIDTHDSDGQFSFHVQE